MSSESALLTLFSALLLGLLVLVAVTAQRLTGTVKLELDLGARALREAREHAQAMRDAMTAASGGVTPLRNTVTVTQPNRDARVTVQLAENGVLGPQVVVPQEPDPEFTAALEAKFNQTGRGGGVPPRT